MGDKQIDEIMVKENKRISNIEISEATIRSLIYVVRGRQVMMDSDLAMLYQVETGALNRAVKRNIKRFPEDFCFRLTDSEYENLKCQIGISSLDENRYGYSTLEVKHTGVFHDRFLIIDDALAYHVGASIKDAGKKCFAISRIEDSGIVKDILTRLKLEVEKD